MAGRALKPRCCNAIGARALDAEGLVLAQQPAERQEDQVLGNMLARSDTRVS
ncbi:MAG: hypothetical protein QM711_15935 [Micropruina sp.]|uniref:hypothetical protein n=1 Tax=Micropruina sp. TaxID=2737536 RepID=UPI0039E40651